jgi:hypothetical protein
MCVVAMTTTMCIAKLLLVKESTSIHSCKTFELEQEIIKIQSRKDL